MFKILFQILQSDNPNAKDLFPYNPVLSTFGNELQALRHAELLLRGMGSLHKFEETNKTFAFVRSETLFEVSLERVG